MSNLDRFLQTTALVGATLVAPGCDKTPKDAGMETAQVEQISALEEEFKLVCLEVAEVWQHVCHDEGNYPYDTRTQFQNVACNGESNEGPLQDIVDRRKAVTRKAGFVDNSKWVCHVPGLNVDPGTATIDTKVASR